MLVLRFELLAVVEVLRLRGLVLRLAALVINHDHHLIALRPHRGRVRPRVLLPGHRGLLEGRLVARGGDSGLPEVDVPAGPHEQPVALRGVMRTLLI